LTADTSVVAAAGLPPTDVATTDPAADAAAVTAIDPAATETASVIVGLPPTDPAADPLDDAAAAAPAEIDAAAAAPATDPANAVAQAPAAADPAPQPAKAAKKGKALEPANPFRRRIEVPEFPKGMEWLNTGRPLTKEDLKGKFVILDFWTYCCINCMHILPELKKLEHKYPKELVVIGVHSAKFETEKVTDNIRKAILRYEIEHPVINDDEHKVWDLYGVSSWPSLLMIDPEGNAVWMRSGECKAEEINEVLSVGIAWYRDQGLLDEKPLKFDLERDKVAPTPLRFPGKILADEASGRLFISDSNHNRIVIATLDGKLIDVIGSGAEGATDGTYKTATFDHPQGCALHGETLYVADTENHLLRKVDLKAKTVTTIAGTGQQAKTGWPGIEQAQLADQAPERWVGPPRSTALGSPWALWVHESDLYIAMAGPHQIWKMPLDESEIGPYAGNGREDIIDGGLLPKIPYMQGFSSFAQPSGLSSDGEWLFVADSEGSSIRAVPFDRKKKVKTVVGSDHLDYGRLFASGDKDGTRRVAKLQHALEVVYLDGQIYVADTYNHKIKVVNAKTGETKTLWGTGEPGASDEPAQFHEPAGLAHAAGKLYVADTNNHLIRTIDLKSGKVQTLEIAGLTDPTGKAKGNPPLDAGAAAPAAPKKPNFKGARQEQVAAAAVKPVDGIVRLQVSLELPEGWKMNPLAPMSYWVDSPRDKGPADRAAFGRTKLAKPAAEFEVPLPVTSAGEDEVQVSLGYSYCSEGDNGVCKIGSVVFTVPLKIAENGKPEPLRLTHAVAE
jgi:thiol-disulfide isomerase/thioredoxin